MPVYIGQVTSEVYSSAPVAPAPADAATPRWDERLRTAAALDRLARDARRTSTGDGDD